MNEFDTSERSFAAQDTGDIKTENSNAAWGISDGAKTARKDRVNTVSWQDKDGIHTQTTVIHKNVPSVWTILITAVTFLMIGAFIAAMLCAVKFLDINGLKSAFGVRREEHENVTERPQNTNPPLVTAPPEQPQYTNPPMQPQSEKPAPVFGESNPMPGLYNEVVDGVVIVRAYASDRKSKYDLLGIGSGFFISDDGYILTNAHVVKDAVSVWIAQHDGAEIKAEIVGSDYKSDVAVLKVSSEKPFKALKIGDSGSVRIGDFVFAVGHPTGEELSFTLTFGTVGAVGRPVLIDGISNIYIQVDAAINPGNSGGPLFDMKGNVVGINSAKTVVASYDEQGKTISAEGLGFALPVNDAMLMARQIIKDGGVQRPGIGVSVITIDEEIAAQFNVPQGALVYSVIKDGPAHKAGLYADDIIVSADGKKVPDKDVFVEIIQSRNVGDSVEIEYWRKGKINKCTLVIGNFNELGSEILDNAYGGKGFGFDENP